MSFTPSHLGRLQLQGSCTSLSNHPDDADAWSLYDDSDGDPNSCLSTPHQGRFSPPPACTSMGSPGSSTTILESLGGLCTQIPSGSILAKPPNCVTPSDRNPLGIRVLTSTKQRSGFTTSGDSSSGNSSRSITPENTLLGGGQLTRILPHEEFPRREYIDGEVKAGYGPLYLGPIAFALSGNPRRMLSSLGIGAVLSVTSARSRDLIDAVRQCGIPSKDHHFLKLEDTTNAKQKYGLIAVATAAMVGVDNPVEEDHYSSGEDQHHPESMSCRAASEFIASRRRHGKGVLVHCDMGIMRSPSVIAAHFILTYGLSYRAATDFMKLVAPKCQFRLFSASLKALAHEPASTCSIGEEVEGEDERQTITEFPNAEQGTQEETVDGLIDGHQTDSSLPGGERADPPQHCVGVPLLGHYSSGSAQANRAAQPPVQLLGGFTPMNAISDPVPVPQRASANSDSHRDGNDEVDPGEPEIQFPSTSSSSSVSLSVLEPPTLPQNIEKKA